MSESISMHTLAVLPKLMAVIDELNFFFLLIIAEFSSSMCKNYRTSLIFLVREENLVE